MKINLGKISEEYELKYVAHIISKYKFKRVAIQLPDKNLDVSIYIVNIIKKELRELRENGIVPNENKIDLNENKIDPNKNEIVLNKNGIVPNEEKVNTLSSDKCVCEHTKVEKDGKPINRECGDEIKETCFYVLGDTTLNECCEDFVSADHVKADCLIHFGNSCQSFLIPYIPSISIFQKKQIQPCFFNNIKKFLKEYKRNVKEKKTHIILSDVSYNEVLNDIVFAFINKEQLKFDENENEKENEDVFFIKEIIFEAKGGVNKRIKDQTNGHINGHINRHINVSLNNQLYNGLNRKENDTTTNTTNGEIESEKKLKKELELINRQESKRENEKETENKEKLEKTENKENIKKMENIENKENKEKTTLMFTGVIVGIHKIASNLENQTYYGFSNNAIAFNTEQDLEKEFLFICGRLMCQIFYDPPKKRIIYKALENHVDLNCQTTEVFIFPKEEQNIEKDPFLNRCVLELGCDYSSNNVYIYKGHNTKKNIDHINMDHINMDHINMDHINMDNIHMNTYIDKDIDKDNGEEEEQVIFFKATKIINSLLLKRYSLISKSKEVESFGIIIGNVNLCKNRELRRLINYILRKRKKRCFTIATNKLNIAKLENFHDIDMYILLTCSENSLLKIENCSKSIINPYELFVALDLIEWTGKYLFEFSHLLNVNSLKEEIEKMETIKNDKYILWKPTLQLLSSQSYETNKLKINGKEKEDEEEEEEEEEGKEEKIKDKEKYRSIINKEYEGLLEPNTSISIENQKKFIQRFHEKSKMCSYFIETLKENDKREFKGMEMNYNTDTITKAVQGLSGIAQCYQTDLQFTNHDRFKIKQQDTRTD